MTPSCEPSLGLPAVVQLGQVSWSFFRNFAPDAGRTSVILWRCLLVALLQT